METMSVGSSLTRPLSKVYNVYIVYSVIFIYLIKGHFITRNGVYQFIAGQTQLNASTGVWQFVEGRVNPLTMVFERGTWSDGQFVAH